MLNFIYLFLGGGGGGAPLAPSASPPVRVWSRDCHSDINRDASTALQVFIRRYIVSIPSRTICTTVVVD